MKDWIDVFKTGTHTDMAGVTRTWTEADLDKIVAASQDLAAPAVIGHPKIDAPAWGWVDEVKKEAGRIWVRFSDLVPEFAEMVKKKMFPNRSIALNPDLSIRHIGFLGAVPPAVKGLERIKFTDVEPMVVIEFSEEADLLDRVFNRMKAFFISEENKHKNKEEPMTKTFTQEELNAEVKEKLNSQKTEYASKIASLEDERKKRDEKIAKMESERKAERQEVRKQNVTSFGELLKKDGHFLPAWKKMGLSTFMQQIEEMPTEIEFAEGKKETPGAFFRRFLLELPKVVTFKEVAPHENLKKGSEFSTDGKIPVDEDRLELHNKVTAYQQAHKDVTYTDAVKAVS